MHFLSNLLTRFPFAVLLHRQKVVPPGFDFLVTIDNDFVVTIDGDNVIVSE